MSKSLITLLNESSRAVATIASVVTLTFVMLILAPTVAAAQDAADEAANEALIAGSEERQLSTAIAKVKRTLEKLQSKLDKNEDGTLEKNELKQLENSVRQLDHTVTQRFDQIGQHIQANNLDPVIEQRQADMVATYRTEFDALVANLANLDSSDASVVAQAVADALAQLNQFTLERPHQPVVPGQFSNFSVEPDFENKPKETETDFTRAGYFDNPYLQLAALGDFTFDRLPGADNPAYLAETDEVRITDAVRAKAAELDNDPVKIYYWVRNNVEWLPTWGAIQDADITLGSLRGNAIDISSLLIALYRASGIPARYVHGAIEVPVDQFNNWAGNFTDTQAALSFASSGGIPLQLHTLTDGETTTTTVHMEHIWVEAALDYFPSRAAVNKDADSWMKLDASFKQYEEVQGLNPIVIAEINPQQVAQQFIDSGVINEAESWVQGFDVSILQNMKDQVAQSMESYIDDNVPNPTVENVIGGQRTIILENPEIPSASSTKIIATGPKYGTLPGSLQPKITFSFGTDIIGEPLNPITFPWSKINNRKVTLSFRPATQADEDVLSSLIPPDADGPEDLPQDIPSYLISVIPELKVEGETVKSGSPVLLGEELLFYNRIDEISGASITDQRSIIVGSYTAFAAIAGSVSITQLERVHEQLGTTFQQLNDLILLPNRESMYGDVLFAGLESYFLQYQTMATIAAKQQQGRFLLPPSAGVFSYEPYVDYFFGIPRSIVDGGLSMDLHRVARIASMENATAEEHAEFGMLLGSISSFLEHAVPEQLMSFQADDSAGISAVKALGMANAEGQKIIEITADNFVDTFELTSANVEIENEIRSYVLAGYTAVIHENAVTVEGWRGFGYILSDKTTGSASFKITGGKNGSFKKQIGFLWTKVRLNGTMLAVVATDQAAKRGLFAIISSIAVILSVGYDLLQIIERCWNDANVFNAVAIYIVAIGLLAFLGAFLAGTGLLALALFFVFKQAAKLAFERYLLSRLCG